MDWTKDFTSTPVNPCHDLTKFEVSKSLKIMLESLARNDCIDTPGIRMAMARAKIEGEDELSKVLEFQLLPLSIEEERRRREAKKEREEELDKLQEIKEQEREIKEQQQKKERKIKEQQQKERIKKEELERKRIEKEELERDRIERAAYRYRDVFHLCSIKNLSSIIEKGLFSRVLVPPGFEDIAEHQIIKRRKKWITYASTYFEPINAMYYAVRRQSEIVIVEFSIDLSKSGIVITDGNAAVGKTTYAKFHSFNFVEIMSELQLETIDAEYKGKDQWPGGETNPDYKEHIRIKQAECLVPEKISRDCIKSIQIAGTSSVSLDHGNTESYVDDLIANSGLPIKKFFFNRSGKPRIIRE